MDLISKVSSKLWCSEYLERELESKPIKDVRLPCSLYTTKRAILPLSWNNFYSFQWIFIHKICENSKMGVTGRSSWKEIIMRLSLSLQVDITAVMKFDFKLLYLALGWPIQQKVEKKITVLQWKKKLCFFSFPVKRSL